MAKTSRVTYIGGPTALLEIGGSRLLTDPGFDAAGTRFESGAYVLTKTKGSAAKAEALLPIDAVLHPWESTTLGSGDGALQITATPARHGPKHGDRGPVIGFVVQSSAEPDDVIYVSGDTVYYEGVEEVARRFHVTRAVLFMGAARVAAVGPDHLTFTAEEAVEVTRLMPDADIVPLHFEGWEHFTEGRDAISRTFAGAGLERRLHWAAGL